MKDPDTTLREAIDALLKKRDPGKTICPSEAARLAFPDDWRDHMETTRRVATQMRAEGKIEICQRGEPVVTDQFSGPIRLRKITDPR